MTNVDWGYFDKFDGIIKKYMPDRGEGETKASQIVTAVNKLIYKWYNDGDVFDNNYHLKGWFNNLSSYANWLFNYTTEDVEEVLDRIMIIKSENAYEHLLKELADICLNEDFLKKFDEIKDGSIYDCSGPYSFDEDKCE